MYQGPGSERHSSWFPALKTRVWLIFLSFNSAFICIKDHKWCSPWPFLHKCTLCGPVWHLHGQPWGQEPDPAHIIYYCKILTSIKKRRELLHNPSFKQSFAFYRIFTGLLLSLVQSNWNSSGQIYEPHCSIPRRHLQPGDRESNKQKVGNCRENGGAPVTDYPWCFIHNEASVPAVHVCQQFVTISSKVDEPAGRRN